MTPQNYYEKVVAEAELLRQKLGRKAFAVAMLRLAVFLAAVAVIVVFWSDTKIVGGAFLGGVALFLFLAKKSSHIAGLKQVENAKIQWAQGNLKRLRMDLDGLPEGKEYVDVRHDYTFDIDVFGKHSLFALLNTTSTPFGRDRLAEWLVRPPKTAEEVALWQDVVKELAGNEHFRLQIASIGQVVSEEMPKEDVDFSDIPDFSVSLWQRVAMAAVPFMYLALFVLVGKGYVPGSAIFYVFLLVLALGSVQAKRVGLLHRWATVAAGRVAGCSGLFRVIESTKFSSEGLMDLQQSISGGSAPASVLTERLSRYIHNLDQRYNVFGYAILNGFLLWDWRQLHNIDCWIKANGSKLAEWKDTVARYDAFCALATFSYNNPDYAFPILDPDGKTIMSAQEAGHPLLGSRCVCNDVSLLSEGMFTVVTGANMAGKSTYLRMVATNYLLALIGAPVFARQMVFTPVSLFTGLRTSDSLSDGTSYFFAELQRLQEIVRRAEGGERMFVILDEILRGTNSADKQQGSLGLIRKLLDLPVAGIIATHDLVLGTLADAFPGKVRNCCFEADISGDKLTFSYRLQEGVAKNANASFLMRQMGIIK